MILVVGATGMLGGEITRRLLEQGKQVRILIRENSPSEAMAGQGMATKASTLIEAGAQPVYGDLKDPRSLKKALEGVETVITTANSALRGGEDNPLTVDLDGNRNLIEAAEASGAEHFIFISVNIANAESAYPFIKAKGITEELCRQSSMHYTILAPAAFMEVWPAMVVGMPAQMGQPVTLIEGTKHHGAFISRNDVAAFAVAAVDNPAAKDQHLLIGGPEVLSWHDVVHKYEQILGRPVEVQYVKMGEPVPGLPEEMSSLLAVFEMGDADYDTIDLARAYGIHLTPFLDAMRAPN